MSKADVVAAPVSPQYLAWLAQERRARISVRGAQIAILLVFLLLWEVLPRAQIVNPMLTSYPSALWPTFVELLQATPRQAIPFPSRSNSVNPSAFVWPETRRRSSEYPRVSGKVRMV